MSLSAICIKRPVFAIVLSLVLVALGAIFFTKLQIRGMPDVDPPVITIASHYSGADALYMEKEITTRIEDQLRTIKGLDFMSSQSANGRSNVILSFKLSTDIEIALNDVRSKISDINSLFPDDMTSPSISKMDSNNFPSLWLSVSSDKYDQLELTKIVQDEVILALDRLENVGQSIIYGGKSYSMHIEPNPVKMYQYRISPKEIESAIKNQNKDYPAGTIQTTSQNFAVRLSASLNKIEDFENIILRAQDNNNLVKLKDVALVHLSPVEENIILRYNGNGAMAIGLVLKSKANIIDLSKEVREKLEVIKGNLPKGVEINIAYDGATPVSGSINAVYHTIFEALILVVLVTYLFLGSVKLTLIPFVTIPIALIATFTAMYFCGFSVNTFTMLAMILAIGLVVDDAIVVLENIFRHHEMNLAPMEAALVGSKEISFVVIAMTITLASVFLPIGFIDGFIGKLFIEFAWTLAFCVLFSGFVALTLTPMMASRIISATSQPNTQLVIKFDQFIKFIQRKYLDYLNYIMDNKKKFLLFASSSIVVLILSLIFVNKAFVPQEDDGFLQIIFTGPEGSNIAQSKKSVIEAERILSTNKDIMGYFEIIGSGGGNSAFAFVPLNNWNKRTKSQMEIRDELNAQFHKIPGMSIFAINPRSMASGGARNAVEFNLQSSLEYDAINKLSQEFIEAMNNSGIFQNVNSNYHSSTPTLDIIIKRDKAYLYGLSIDDIGTSLSYFIDGKRVGDFRMGNDIYNVILQYNVENRSNVSDLRKIMIKNNKNIFFPLEVAAHIEEKIAVASYNHYNSTKAISISADLSETGTIDKAIKEINKISSKLVNSGTIKLEYIGEIKRMQESESNSMVTFLFAIIFIYLVLAAQFESFTDPLLILVAVPFSITGGVAALLLFGNSINMYSNIGLITLIGLITKNSIMIVEFANTERLTGCSIREAIIKAAHVRLRPILMTTIATICGAIPLVIASGAGAASRNSIGLVIIGGMLVGTIFTIFVIPVLYQTFKRKTYLL
jgi:HAE1 family hydrophobic/amphiphilic exporter-1